MQLDTRHFNTGKLMKKQPIRVLVVEDLPDDAELMILQLRGEGFEPDWQRVEDEGGFLSALDQTVDLILADYTLPKFSGLQALALLKERGLDIPLIIVSGTIGEEIAVEAIKVGAYDYVLKEKMKRLGACARNALREKRLRDDAGSVEAALKDSEVRFRKLIENAPDGFSLLDSNGRLKYASPSTQRILGYTPEEILGTEPAHATHPDDLPDLLVQLADLIQNPGKTITTRYRFRHKDNSWRWLESTITNQLNDPSVQAIVFNYRDFTERQQAEAELRGTEKKYRTLIEQLPAVTYLDFLQDQVRQGESTNAYLSPQVETLLGYLPADFYGDPALWARLIHPDDRQSVLARNVEHYTTRTPYRDEYRMLTRAGNLIWVRDESIVVAADDGTLTSQGIIFDITERKQAEEALKKSEANLAAAQGIAHIGSWELELADMEDLNNNSLRWSDEVFRIFGYLPGEIQVSDEVFYGAVHPEDRDRVAEAVNTTLRTGETYSLDHRIIRPDGVERIVHEQSEIIRDGQGRASKMVGTVQDVTERRLAEDRLVHERYLLQTLMNLLPDRIYIKDLESRFLLKNLADVRAMGAASMEEVIGKTDFDYYPQELAAQYFANDQTIIRSGEPLIDFEEPGIDQTGSQRWLLTTKVPLRDSQGQIIGLVGIGRDITERKQREVELEALASVSAALRKAATRAEMLPIILDQLFGLLKVDAASLAMRDTTNGETVIELAGGSWSSGTGRRIPAGEGISGQVIATGNPYLNNDVDTDQRYIPPLSDQKLSAAACVPLKAQEQTIGALWIARQKPISPIEVHLLTAISNIAASAIQRATLFEQTQKRLQQISALHSIDIAISSSFDLRFTLNILLEQVSSHLGVDATDVLLLNPHTQMLEYVAGRGFLTGGMDRLKLRLGEGAGGQAALQRRIVSIPNLQKSEGVLVRMDFYKSERFISYYGVPLIAKGQVKGVLEIFHRSALNPDPDWLNFLETLAEQAAIAINDATMFDNLQRSNTELILAYDATIEGWSRALDLRDNETEGHTQRVTATTLNLARIMNLAETERIHLRRGSLLHDIGKMGIPDSILLKPGQLTDEEWVVMRKHPVYAYELIRPIEFLRPALDIPYCHHEKWDGTGYPRGLKGDHIPIAARIFTLADVWDALLSDRPYRKAWTKAQARGYIISENGKHFDPAIADVFLKMEEED